MALTETHYRHVVRDERGVPVLAGTDMKVIQLVLEHQTYGWSSEELHFQHPYLSLGQIHSALAYYWDHRKGLDEDIARRLRQADEYRDRIGDSPLRVRLETEGLLG